MNFSVSQKKSRYLQCQNGKYEINGSTLGRFKNIITLILTNYAKRKEKERSQDGNSQTQKKTEKESS